MSSRTQRSVDAGLLPGRPTISASVRHEVCNLLFLVVIVDILLQKYVLQRSVMKLTKKQISINENPNYWTWFEKWWDEDFSYEALLSKDILNEEDKQIYEDVKRRNHGNLVKFAGRDWHPYNIPPHDLEGNLADGLLKNTQNILNGIKKLSIVQGIIRVDFNPDLLTARCAVWSHFGGNIPRNLEHMDRCLLTNDSISSRTFTSCRVLTTTLLAENNISFRNCYFEEYLKFSAKYNASVDLQNACGLKSVKFIKCHNVEIQNSFIKNISLVISHDTNVNLSFPRNHTASLRIENYDPSKSLLALGLIVNWGNDHNIFISDCKIKEFHSNSDTVEGLHFSTLGNLRMINCKVDTEFSLNVDEISSLDFSGCDFSAGFNFTGAKV